jgi:hypothetical protein
MGKLRNSDIVAPVPDLPAPEPTKSMGEVPVGSVATMVAIESRPALRVTA